MAIPWLLVLQSVPWTDVIKNVPKVTEGAKKLWSSVSKKTSAPGAADGTKASVPPKPQPIATLQARLDALEITATELHSQMLASSELIKTLADQNAQLVARFEATRIRVRWLTVATIVLGVITAVSLAPVFVR
jgi:hypothetical protein